MGRDRAPRHKRSRREGKDLYGTGGESLARRMNVAPGARSGQQRRARMSEYAQQLREKQKVKRMYGMRESQFRRFYQLAQRSHGQTGLALLKLLERRLDNVVYRLGFARTRQQARQFVNHGHVRVDGMRVDIPSYLTKTGEEIRIDPTVLEIPDVKDLREASPPVPGWLEKRDDGGRILREPQREEIDADIAEQRIVEFYSR
jgi:small subunit ribosomal protein S4